MRKQLRRLSLAGLAAVALAAIAAPGASAQMGINFVTGAPLAVGSMTNAVSSTNIVFTGVAGTTVTCASSEFDGTVLANPPLTEQVDLFTFTGCGNNLGMGCVVSAQGLPWSPAAGGLLANGMPGAWMLTLGMASGDYLDIACGGGVPCSYRGAGVGPGPLTGSMTGGWTNPAPPAPNDLSFSNAPLQGVATGTGNNCGAAAFSTMYIIRTGTLPGGGNPIALV